MNKRAGNVQAWHPYSPAKLETAAGTQLTLEADAAIQSGGPNPDQDDYRLSGPIGVRRVTAIRLEVLPHESNTGGGLSRSESGHFILSDIKLQVQEPGGGQSREIPFSGAVADYSADPTKHDGYGNVANALDDDPRTAGPRSTAIPSSRRTAIFALAEPLVLAAGEEVLIELRQRSSSGHFLIGRFRLSLTDELGSATHIFGPTPLELIAAAAEPERPELIAKLKDALRSQFLADFAPDVAAQRAFSRANGRLEGMKSAADKVNVMVLSRRRTAAIRTSWCAASGTTKETRSLVRCRRRSPPARGGRQKSARSRAGWLAATIHSRRG